MESSFFPICAMSVVDAFGRAFYFAVEFCPADLVAIYVINSVGVVGVSVVYSCESTVFVGFVADASAAQKDMNSSWHLIFIWLLLLARLNSFIILIYSYLFISF
jgi:hypothetical protein